MDQRPRTLSKLTRWLKRLLRGDHVAPSQTDGGSAQQNFIDLFVTPLEPRRVLNADFTLVGGVLDLTAFDGDTTEISIQENGGSFEFILNNGTWDDVELSPDLAGGTDTLTVEKTLVTDVVRINDTAGGDVDVTIDDVEFTNLTSAAAVFEVDNISTATITGDVVTTDADIDIDASRSVFMAANSSITTVDGDIQLRGNVTITAAADGSVSYDRGSATGNGIGVRLVGATVETTGSGDVQILGGGYGSSSFWNGDGVRIEGSLITTAANLDGGGNIEIWGISADGAGNANGIDMRADGSGQASLVSADTGTIEMTGVSYGTDWSPGIQIEGGSDVTWAGSLTDSGTDVDRDAKIVIEGESNAIGRGGKGVEIDGAGTTVSSTFGDIDIIGRGALGAETNTTGDTNNDSRWNHGIEVLRGASIHSSGTGDHAANVSLNGAGRTGIRSISGVNFWDNGSVTTIDGDISIDGTSATTTGGFGYGVNVANNSALTSTGSGNIEITGKSLATGGSNNDGVRIWQAGTQVSVADGTLTITGVGSVNATGNLNRGVGFFDQAIVEATGSGAIEITGKGGGGTSDLRGVEVWNQSILRAVDGSITIVGTGGNGSSFGQEGVGIFGDTTVETTGSGLIDITGVGGRGSQQSDGIQVLGQVVASGSGSIVLSGIGGKAVDGSSVGGSFANMGVYIDAGAATYGSTFESSNASVMSRTGDITIHGTGGTRGNFAPPSYGVFVDRQGGVYSVSGHITLVGIEGDGNDGIEFDGGRIYSTGSASTSWISDSRIRLQPGSTIDLNTGSILLQSPDEIDLFGSVAGGSAEIDSVGSRLRFGESGTTEDVDISGSEISRFHSGFGITPLTIGRGSEVFIDESPRVIDDFTFADGATVTFVADDSNALPQGQLQLGGTSRTVFLNDATLNLLPDFFSDVLGNELVLVDLEDAGSSVDGTFNGLAEGAIFEAGAHRWQISYAGGDGNDVSVTAVSHLSSETLVSLDADGNLVIDDIATTSDDQLRITVDGDQIVISDPTHTVNFDASIQGAIRRDVHEVRVLRSEVTGDQIIVNTLSGDDTLIVGEEEFNDRIQNAAGDPLTIVYNAGDATDNDTLEVKSFRSHRAYVYGAGGEVDITARNSSTEQYSVRANGIETVLDLDPVFTATFAFTDESETISFTNPETGVVRIASDNIPVTNVFQSFFLDELTIDLGGGDDVLNLEHVGAPDELLQVIGGDGNDIVTFGTLVLGDRLNVDADSIVFDDTVSMGTVFSVFNNGFGVTLNATDSISGDGGIIQSHGDITLSAGSDIGEAGNPLEISDEAITANSTSGSIYLANDQSVNSLSLTAATGDVVFASAGVISDSDDDADVVAARASLTGTSSSVSGVGNSVNSLQLEVSALQVDTSAGGGDQYLDVQGILDDIDLDAGTGDISLVSSGAIPGADDIFGDATDIRGGTFYLTIEDDLGSLGSAADPITTMLGGIVVTKTLDAFIEEFDALRIESVVSPLGGTLSFASTDINVTGPIDSPGGEIVFRNSGTDSLTQIGGESDVSFAETVDAVDGYRFTVAANEFFENVGYDISSAGDINGDGIADLLIAAPFYNAAGDAERHGRVFVVFGGLVNLQTLDGHDGSEDGVIDLESLGDVATAGGFQIRGGPGNGRLGVSATSVGDFNGDGLDDLLIGAQGSPYADPKVSGRAYLLFGEHESGDLDLSTLDDTIVAADPLDADRRIIAIGDSNQPDYFGGRVASGDINGDGFSDIALSANERPDVFVLFGFDRDSVDTAIDDTDLLDGNDDGLVDLAGIPASAGYQISTSREVKSIEIVNLSGDEDPLTGRGSADLVIGSEELDSSTVTGMTYILFGEDLADLDAADGTIDANIDSSNATLRLRNMDGERSVEAVAGVGDINGDGEEDLGIAVRDQPFGVAGKAYVVFGGETQLEALDIAGTSDDDGLIELANLNGSNGFRVIDIDAFGAEGGGAIAISTAGDINGDGIDDVLIGAAGAGANAYSYSGQGALRIVFGKQTDPDADGVADNPFAADLSADSFDGTNGVSISGADAQVRSLGYSVAGIGDINGDGIDDIAVGAPDSFFSYSSSSSSSSSVSHRPGNAFVVFGQSPPPDLDTSAYHLSDEELALLGSENVTIRTVGINAVTRIIDDIYLPSASGMTFDGDGIVEICADATIDGSVPLPPPVGPPDPGDGGGGGDMDTLIFNQEVIICQDATLSDFGSGIFFNDSVSFAAFDSEDPNHHTDDPAGQRTLTLDVTQSTHPAPVVSLGDDATDELTLVLDGDGTDPTQVREVIDVRGQLQIGGSLNLVRGPDFTLQAGSSFILINHDNDGVSDGTGNAGAITGTFATINGVAGTEGAVFTVGGREFRLTYTGGDGNDVALSEVYETLVSIDAGGNLVVDDIETASDDVITVAFDAATNEYVVTSADHSIGTDVTGAEWLNSADPAVISTVRIDAATVTGSQIIVNTGLEDDVVTVDLTDAPFTNATGEVLDLVYDAGGQGAVGDSLVINNSGDFATHTYTYHNANDVDVALTDGTAGASQFIQAIGIEPLTNDDSAVDVVFNLPDTDNFPELTDIGGGMLRLGNSTTPATFEQTDFMTPMAGGSLTINLGGGDDAFDGYAMTLNPEVTFTISGGDGTDLVHLQDALTLSGDLLIDAENVLASGSVSTGGSDVTIITNDIDVDGTIDAGTGTITFVHATADSLIQIGGETGFDANTDLADVDRYIFTVADSSVSQQPGVSISSAGDINGDGVEDLLIGAPYVNNFSGPRTGRVYVVFGGDANLSKLDAVDGSTDNMIGLQNLPSVPTSGFRIDGPADVGTVITAVGDVNGDGMDDLLVGGSGYYATRTAYLVFGHLTGDVDLNAPGSNVLTIAGEDPAGDFGSAVAAGDVNNDGRSDLLIAAEIEKRAYLIYGAEGAIDDARDALDGIDGTVDGVLNVGSINQNSGAVISTPIEISSVAMGDVSGDGTDDLLFGGRNPDSSGDRGHGYVLFGESLSGHDGNDGAANGQIDLNGGAFDYHLFGEPADRLRTIVTGGDLNGDGVADLLLGDTGGGAGRAYVVFGDDASLADLDAVDGVDGEISIANVDGMTGFRLPDAGAVTASGTRVDLDYAFADDINGDDIDDLIIGQASSDDSGGHDASLVRILYGKMTDTNGDGTADDPFDADVLLASLDGSDGFTIVDDRFDRPTIAVASADINGDGLEDILVGTAPRPYVSASDSSGAAYVVFGVAAPDEFVDGEFHLSDSELAALGADTVVVDAPGSSSVTRVIDDVYLPSARGLIFDGDGIVEVCADIVVDGTVPLPAAGGGGGGEGDAMGTLIFNQEVVICQDTTLSDSGSGVFFNDDFSFAEFDPEDPDHDTADPVGHRTLILDVTSSTHPNPTIQLGDDDSDEFSLRLSGLDAATVHEQIVIHRDLGDAFVPGQLAIAGSLNLEEVAADFSLSDGAELILIDNDGTEAIAGQFEEVLTSDNIFSGAEGTTITLNGNNYLLSYTGGDGNDVVLTSEPVVFDTFVSLQETTPGSGLFDLVVEDVNSVSSDSLVIEVDDQGTADTSDDRYLITTFNFLTMGSDIASAVQESSGSVSVLISDVTGDQVIFTTDAGFDDVTIDLNGGLLAHDVTVHGDSADFDRVTVVNDTSLARQTIDLASMTDGQLSLDADDTDGNNNEVTISFSGIEELLPALAVDTTINLYDGVDHDVNMYIHEGITVQAFATTPFDKLKLPAVAPDGSPGSLTVNGGNGDDTLTVELDFDYTGHVTLNGNGGDDVINLLVNTNSGATAAAIGGDVNADGEQVNVTGDGIVTDGGDVNITANNVDFEINASINAGSGQVTFTHATRGGTIALGDDDVPVGELHLSTSELAAVSASSLTFDAPGDGVTRTLSDLNLSHIDTVTFNGDGHAEICDDVIVGTAGGGGPAMVTLIFNQDVIICADVTLTDHGSGIFFNGNVSFGNFADPTDTVRSLTLDVTGGFPNATVNIGDDAADVLTLQLDGPRASTQLDLIEVNGALQLTGSLDIVAGDNFSLPFGGTLILISNDGDDAIGGTFATVNGIAGTEGATITLDGVDYELSYIGNDGNDVTLTRANTSPVADAGGPYSVDEGVTITLDASGSTDAEEDPEALLYEWDLDGDGSYDDADGQFIDFAAIDGPDVIVVGLQVTDQQGAAHTDTATITVNNVAPTPAIDDITGDRFEGSVLQLTGSATDPAGANDTLIYEWDFGDGSTDTGSTTTHTFTDDGTYTVSLTVSDEDGGSETITQDVVIDNVTPTVTVNNAAVTVDEGRTATNTGTFDDVGDDVVSVESSVGSISQFDDGTWEWTFDTTDGPDDSQTVTITATDSDGVFTTTTFGLTVTNVAPTVVVDAATVVVDEGDTATNSGTTFDPGVDVVTVTSSIGSINQLDDGAWEWSFETTDGPDDSQVVTITATDSDGAITTTTFGLTVTNVAPTVVADAATVVVDEGDTATNSGTSFDPGADVMTVTSSVGNINQDGDDWTWSFDTTDGPDESQVVTITATDDDGESTTTMFDLIVNNVAPIVAADTATLTLNEGQSTTNSGTFGDVGDDTVTISASVGDIVQDDLASTWSWSYDSTDGPDDSQTVTITATDDDGDSTTATFDVIVVNVTPELTIDAALITVDEGSTATNSGATFDPGDDSVTLTASVGNIDLNDNNTWTWSFDTTDGPSDSQTVTITATDSDGAVAVNTFDLVVQNVAPVFEPGDDETVAAADNGAFTRNGITFIDPGTADVHSVSIDYDGDSVVDETIDLLTGEREFDLGYSYASSGVFTVTVVAADDDGGTFTDTFDVTVEAPEVEFTRVSYEVSESTGDSMVVTLTRSGDSATASTVEVQLTSGGTATAGTDSTGDFDATSLPFLATFEEGESTATVIVPINDDDVVEQNETINLEVVAVSNVVIGPIQETTLTIIDDDTAEVSVAVLPAIEGNDLQFEVTLSQAVDVDTVIGWSTEDGSATVVDNDYVQLADHSLTIAAGDTTGTIVISTNADDVVELDETVTLRIFDVAAGGQNVSLPGDSGILNTVGVIRNDDSSTVTISDATAAEGDDLQFTVTLDQAVDVDTIIDYATSDGTAVAGEDYTSTTGQLTITAGSQTGVIVVATLTDANVEINETLTVSLSNISTNVDDAGDRDVRFPGAAATVSGTGTITDDQTTQFTINEVVVDEGVGTASFIISIDRPLAVTTEVQVSLSGSGSDANLIPPTTVTFAAGAVDSQTVTVAVVDDDFVESTEELVASITVFGAEGFSVDDSDTGTLAINDNDGPGRWSITGDSSVDEGGVVEFAVALSGQFGAGEVVSVNINYADAQTSASDLNGSDANQDELFSRLTEITASRADLTFDVVTGTLTFTSQNDGDQMEDITLQLTAQDDSFIEGSESFSMELTDANSSSGAAVAVDDTAAELQTTINDTQGIGGPPDGPAIWELSGSTDVDEGSIAEYTIDLQGEFGLGQTAAAIIVQADETTDAGDLGDTSPNQSEVFRQLQTTAASRSDLTFDPTTGLLTFQAQSDGQTMTPVTVSLPVEDDPDVEGVETFTLSLALPSFSPGTAPQAIGSGLVLTSINDTQGVGGPPDSATPQTDPGVIAGFFPGGQPTPIDEGLPDFTAFPAAADSEFVPGFSADGGVGSGSSVASEDESNIQDLEEVLLYVASATDEFSQLDKEEVYFQIVRPDGTLGPKIPLPLEVLDNDSVLNAFAKFPNNVYRIMYRDAGIDTEQQLYELNVQDHRIVPTLVPREGSAIVGPDVENDPVAADPPASDPTVSETSDPSDDREQQKDLPEDATTSSLDSGFDGSGDAESEGILNPIMSPRTASVAMAVALLTRSVGRSSKKQMQEATDTSLDFSRAASLMRRHSK